MTKRVGWRARQNSSFFFLEFPIVPFTDVADKDDPVATLNTRRLLRNHLLTAFPTRKEITDTNDPPCEAAETRPRKNFFNDRRSPFTRPLLYTSRFSTTSLYPVFFSLLSVSTPQFCPSFALCSPLSSPAVSLALVRTTSSPFHSPTSPLRLFYSQLNEENFMLRVNWHN